MYVGVEEKRVDFRMTCRFLQFEGTQKEEWISGRGKTAISGDMWSLRNLWDIQAEVQVGSERPGPDASGKGLG